ncbi:hypothetical protein QZH41_011012 [Actinostola sp. cb2023]|nr:hypothetical protein QZH41_011012 [Actinostola sp. cb2023]
MSEFEQHEIENGVVLSSASSRSTESLDENIRKILTVVESKGRVLLDCNEMSEAVQQLVVEGNRVGEFLAQIHYQNRHSSPERMATEQLTSNTKRSTSCPEDLAKNCSNPQQKYEGNDNKVKRNSDKGPSRDTWELDSGTHDLGNYEPALQQLMSAANAKGQSRSSNFLELANTLHLAALASLKNEIVEVSGKLRQVIDERDSLKNNATFTNEDRKELIRDYEERLLAQAQQSEEQITELQSVIAELNKKLTSASANKIEELEEVESQTSEHGSRSSESIESIESNDNEDDDVDDELSRVVGELEFAIEREKPEPKESKKDKEPIKVTVKVIDDKNNIIVEASKASLGKQGAPGLEKQQQDCNQLTDRARELREHCVELEKKKQVLERQLQQASLREYVARKKSSSIGSEGGPHDSPCNECGGLRTKLNKTTFELENSRKEIDGFKEERDKLRRRILEMQDHLKALHQKTISYESCRTRSSSFHEPSGPRSPRQQRANPPMGVSPMDPRGPHSGSRSFPRPSNYSSAASDVSSRDGFLAASSPRTARRSSTENLNASMSSRSPSTPRRSVTMPGNYGRRSSGGSGGPTWNPENPTMAPRGSVQSVASSQMFWKGAATSDLGSSHGSTQEITVMARPVDEGTETRMSGDQCIRSLSQLPEFANGRLPNELLRSLRGCRNLQDVYKVLFGYCDDQADKKLKEYELEIERLNCTVDHLQSQINVISLSLEESRENAEKMCVLMGKYESNNTVSLLSLSSCDKVIEAYEVLLQLSESEQSCIYANYRATDVKTDLITSQNSSYRFLYSDSVAKERQANDVEECLERRRTAESEARSLLQRLDRDLDGQFARDQPWESVSSRSRTSSGSSNENVEFTREEETRLKSYIQQLKSERSIVGATVLELQGIHDIPEPSIEALDPKLDLENAVLMQELMSLKEEKAELKARNYLIEKEKKALELKINSRDAQEQAYLVQIEQLKSEVKEELKRRRRLEREKLPGNKDGNLSGNLSSSGSGSGNLSDIRMSDDDLPTDLQEAAIREKKLRIRIKELMEALESLSKNSETRHTQTAEYVSDLKRANGEDWG